MPDDIELIPDLEEDQVKEILDELEKTNLQILLKMKEDIFDDAGHNIKKTQKRQKINYDIRHSGNKTKLEIGDMVVNKNQVNVAHKGGRLDAKRQSVYYIIEEFLSNGCVILWDLHLNMLVPVPIPQSHLKKIILEDETDSDYEQYSQESNGKRKQNMTTSRYVKTNNNATAMADTEYKDETNTGINTDITTDTSMNTKPNITSYEQLTEIDPEESKEGIDPDVIFTSDEEDNIFSDVVKEDTLGYIKSDDELQIVGEIKQTFHFNLLTRSSREEVGSLVWITKFQDIPFQGIGEELRGLPNYENG